MPLAARQLIKVHLDSARFRMNKIKLAHAAEFHTFRTLTHPSFFSKIFCYYRRSVLHTLPNTVDNFTNLRRCIEKLARLIQTDASRQKKGTSIATSAHFAAVRGILCVQCFLLITHLVISVSTESEARLSVFSSPRPIRWQFPALRQPA
ncbi:hypothetical protein BvCmsNSNP002_04662 [Escherichia coli]|nr:Uncharacterised protein [Escherichia coli]SVF07206.1 Uncharacterised protein [Escherichia coli]GCI81368.1 hypothetical protein BvCmsA102A_00517 [Escherichia coli]GCK30434.1 hypothetical protein BvCmsB39A_00436 [Escherichia coli]GCK93760.1 hypothetical protein BvCmsG22A_04471 [Escherichia coli]